ncbi:cytochrome P450 [Dichomitus squalens LYAD-421 SS1]|uniref:cytochrome P450 n=1 Tax=Dichomitus squalens (strain LYAD-421) TaxID=732165 RepID=UPI0004413D7B|nr:cytochrome P450 [Dichomitus squalens LYAD-421 SS1]EJF67303.1 cytochrome P450 [Dichomitus squalens LYAD-421 SS1]
MVQPLLILLLCPLGVYLWHRYRDPLNTIPTVGGPSLPLLSYLGSYRFFFRAQELIQAGYDKYRGSAFKVAMFDQWLVVLSGPELVEDVRKLPDDVASPGEGVLFLTQVGKYMHPEVLADHYHVDLIRNTLTRQLNAVLPAIVDEVEVVCGELLPTVEGDIASLPGSKTVLDIVSRIISRAFVGQPLCRNKQYLDAAVSFTIDLVKARIVINLFPERMKWFVSRFITGPSENLRRVMGLLLPVVNERVVQMRQRETKTESTDVPNDILQWILEEAQGRKEPLDYVAMRLQLQNFAAIHTSSSSLTHAFFHMLSRLDIVPVLREEVESALAPEGWTKTALDKMWKLDSLLKESQRFTGITLLGMIRRAVQDVKLVDGTYLPRGTLFAFAGQATHTDTTNYDGADEFDPFRFSDVREGGDSARHQYVNTSSDYIAFGRGKHACPGRFFASMELKVVLAYLILTYDMTLEGDAGRPANINLSFSVIPSRDAVVRFERHSR